MNRRTLLRTAGVAGSLAVAGCLETDSDSADEPETDQAPVRHGRPAYSSWPPAESHDGGGVVSYHLELSSLQAIQQAVDADRLDSTQSVVGLPLSGIDPIVSAVESLSSYPFGTALQQAVNAAANPEDREGNGETVVDPSAESILPTNESAVDYANETDSNDIQASQTEVDNGQSNETEVDDYSTNSSNVTAETDGPTAESEVEPEELTTADIGIELDAVTLTDGLLVFEGSFDQTSIVDRFGTGFEQVDTQRGISIYEGRNDAAGLGFGLTGTRLFVPTEDAAGNADGERVLAHVLSGYISTLNRIVDEGDGEWLFETTGESALSVVVWELSNTEEFVAETTVSNGLSADEENLFSPLSSFVSTLSVTVEEHQLTAAEARFSGLFPAGPPAENEFISALVDDTDPEMVYREPPRAHLTAAVSDF